MNKQIHRTRFNFGLYSRIPHFYEKRFVDSNMKNANGWLRFRHCTFILCHAMNGSKPSCLHKLKSEPFPVQERNPIKFLISQCRVPWNRTSQFPSLTTILGLVDLNTCLRGWLVVNKKVIHKKWLTAILVWGVKLTPFCCDVKTLIPANGVYNSNSMIGE